MVPREQRERAVDAVPAAAAPPERMERVECAVCAVPVAPSAAAPVAAAHSEPPEQSERPKRRERAARVVFMATAYLEPTEQGNHVGCSFTLPRCRASKGIAPSAPFPPRRAIPVAVAPMSEGSTPST